MAAPGETWPHLDGAPARGVLQLLVEELPSACEALAGIGVLALFTRDGEVLPWGDDDEDGRDWCVRTYAPGAELVPLEDPRGEAWRPIRWRKERDMAAHTWCIAEHVPADVFARFQCALLEADRHSRLDTSALDEGIEHFDSTKVGGWPSAVQYGPPWASYNRDSEGDTLAKAEYCHVLQVGDHGALGLNWTDCGTLYLGRNRADPDNWILVGECS